jgi:hypothetical protein
MNVRVWLALAAFSLAGLSSAAADIYRWRDDAGGVHFGNRPPTNARDIRLMFKEIPSGAATGSEAAEGQAPSVEAVIEQLEDERQRELEMAKKASEQDGKAPPTRAEIIAREENRLKTKIEQLEQMPLEQFGSQRNKRAQIGFYEYRLQDLQRDPDAYFSNPVQFEGNIPTQEKAETN